MEGPVRRFPGILSFVCAIVLAACGPRVAVHAERSTIATFGRYDTYAWSSGAAPARSPAETEASLFDWRIRNAVDRGLGAKGYVRTSGPASLLVNYDVAVRQQDAYSFREYFRYRQLGGAEGMGGSWVQGYEEGTLVLYLVDARTREVAYRASASGVIAPGADGKRVEDAVGRMLADLPTAMTR
jgi:hypothetical protein